MNFEGAPVDALVDTGSPVTIVSLNFLLRTLAGKRPKGQTPAEWEKEVKARMEPPAITLRNYGGGELNIVRQMTVVIERGDHKCQAVVLIQKGAPLDLLLGTDLHSNLGFLLLKTGSSGMAVDLLQGEKWMIEHPSFPPTVDASPSSKPELCFSRTKKLWYAFSSQ